MRKTLIVTFLVLAFAMFSSMAGAEEKCPVCGVDAEKSPTKAIVTMDGKDIPVCGVKDAYLLAFVKREGAKPDDLNDQKIPIKVRDFKTGKMFNFYEGFYLIESDLEVKGAPKPPILGFSTLEEANAFWKANEKYGGRVANFETATREFYKSETGPSEASKKASDKAAQQVEHLLKQNQK